MFFVQFLHEEGRRIYSRLRGFSLMTATSWHTHGIDIQAWFWSGF